MSETQFDWTSAPLRNERNNGWVTDQGEWVTERPELLVELSCQSLTNEIKWWRPHGIMRYRVPINTTSFFEVFDSRSGEWLGHYETFNQAANAFESHSQRVKQEAKDV